MRLLFFIFLLLLSQSVFAFNLSIPEKSINVPLGSTRQLEINIASPIEDRFKIGIVGSKPWMSLSSPQPSLDAGESRTIFLYMSPSYETPQTLYKITMNIESMETGEKKENEIFISVVKGEGVSLERVTVVGNFMPTGNLTVTAYARNYGTVTANNVELNISLSSPTEEITKRYGTVNKIDPDQSMSYSSNFILPAGAVAGEYTVDVTLSYDEKGFSMEKTFVVNQTPVKQETIERIPSLLGSGKRITIRNDGNVPITDYEITEEIATLADIFYYGDTPDEKDGSMYTWIVSVVPGSEVTISYVVDYTLILLAILAIGFILWMVLFRLKTIRIRKFIMQEKIISEGSEFTVGIEVKNSVGNVSDVIVRDFVPSVFEIRDAQGPKPKRKKGMVGTELTWEIDHMRKGDERVFSYKIVPVFGVSGTVNLPQASVKFVKGGKTMINRSASAHIGVAEKVRRTIKPQE